MYEEYQTASKLPAEVQSWSLSFAKAHVLGEYSSSTNYFLPNFFATASSVICHSAPRGQDSRAQHGFLCAFLRGGSCWLDPGKLWFPVPEKALGYHGNSVSVSGTCLVPLTEVRKSGPLSLWGQNKKRKRCPENTVFP